MTQRILFSVSTILMAVLLGAFGSEIILRIFFPQQEPLKCYESSERYGSRLRKNLSQDYRFLGSEFVMKIRTNSLGLRDNEVDLSQEDDYRIVLLGDSFVFGQGVNAEETFDTYLEEMLNETTGQFTVLNTGHHGWGTLQESRFVRDHFELFRPDVIVLTFCGNDPYDDLKFLNNASDKEKGVFYFPGKMFLRNHSHLYRFLMSHFKTKLYYFILRKDISKKQSAETDIQSMTVLDDELWGRTLSYIEDLHRSFLEFNPKGILLIQATNPLDPHIRNHLRSLSNGRSLVYIDLGTEAEKLTPEQRRLPFDLHWSPRMHRISAERLKKVILQEVQLTN